MIPCFLRSEREIQLYSSFKQEHYKNNTSNSQAGHWYGLNDNVLIAEDIDSEYVV